LPYLTANVQFEAARRTNVLFVANNALRWSPTPQQIAPEFRRSLASPPDQGGSSADAASSTGTGGAGPKGRPGILWVESANGLRPLAVRTGLTDGRRTEVQGDGVAEGLKVVTGAAGAAAAPPPTDANPFAPQLGRGGQGGRGR
jgi:HlyD family secretion protein